MRQRLFLTHSGPGRSDPHPTGPLWRAFLGAGLLSTWALSATASAAADIGQLRKAAQDLNLAQHPAWHALLHYRPKVFTPGRESQADDPSFFLSPRGKQDPAAELDATLQAFAQGDAESGPPPQCRFPARFHWLRQQGAPFDSLPSVDCPELDEWLRLLNTAQVTLVFASSYLNSPSSMFGHTFLRLDPPDLDQGNPILANTISYAADAAEHDNELLFAYRGIFGGYPGITTVEPYYDKLRLYNQLENRDLWEYRLNLDADEVRQLLRHTWEIKDKRFDYFFFDENCAYRLLTLIDVARPGTELIPQINPLRAIPADTVRLVVANGLVDSVHYRASQASQLRHRLRQLSPAEQVLAAGMFSRRQLPGPETLAPLPRDRQAAVLDAAYELTRYRTLVDKLPRNETAGLSYSLLKERARLPVRASQEPLPTPPVRDDQGHATGRASLAGGRGGDRNFLQLDLRPAYHDLHDPAPGYRNGSQLQFLNTELRYYLDKREIQLEQINLVDILSLAPRDPFFRPITWGAGFGFDRQWLEDGERPLAPYVRGSAGHTYEVGPGLAYGLVTGDLRIGSHLPKGYQLAPGLALGWSLQNDWISWQLRAASRFFPGQDQPAHHQWGGAVDFHWTERLSLTLSLEREKIGRLQDTSAQGGLRVYF